MLKKLIALVKDFSRGYSVQKSGTEETVSRNRYFENEKRRRDLGSPFAGFYNVHVLIESINEIQRQLQRLKATRAETLGRRMYNFLHRSLARECCKTNRNQLA